MNIPVKTSTNIFDKANSAGAPIETATKIKITYIKTFDAAFFSTNAFSLVDAAVSSNSVATSPPDFIPEIIKAIVFAIFSEFILLAISSIDSSMFGDLISIPMGLNYKLLFQFIIRRALLSMDFAGCQILEPDMPRFGEFVKAAVTDNLQTIWA